MENLKSDTIINPFTNREIEKYGAIWWLAIKNGVHEDILESQPLVFSQSVHLTKVKYLENIKNFRPQRAGVILYTIIQGRLLFGFGVDSKYHELTDFAGGVNRHDKNPVNTALRELCEETLNLLCHITYKGVDNVLHLITDKSINDSLALYDKHHLVIFYKINQDIDEMTINFNERKKMYPSNIEVEAITWITEEELKITINQQLPYMYLRLLNFLSKAGNFYDYLV